MTAHHAEIYQNIMISKSHIFLLKENSFPYLKEKKTAEFSNQTKMDRERTQTCLPNQTEGVEEVLCKV